MRVVSLLAGATEMVCALGAGETLVGRSHECDNPSWVRSLPPCSQPAFDISVSSAEIDAEVRRRLHAGEPLYHIDMELIRSLQPDLVITQSHCDVCAVTPADLERGGCAIAARQLSLSAATIEEIFYGIAQVAEALDLPERARSAVIERERQRLETRAPADRASPPAHRGLAGMDRPVLRHGQLGSRTSRDRQRRTAAWSPR